MIPIFTTNHPIYLTSEKLLIRNCIRFVSGLRQINWPSILIKQFCCLLLPTLIPNDQVIIKFGRKKVSQEMYVKFLEVLLDSTLSWKPHITELSKKLSRTVVVLLYKIRHYAPLETLKLLYYGIFFPFISDGVQVWELTYPTHLDKVFILQKKIIKCMTFNDIMVPSSSLFHELEFLKLNDINNLQIVSFVYECINGFKLLSILKISSQAYLPSIP